MFISVEVNRILLLAKEEAVRLGNKVIEADHLFLGILRDVHNRACRVLDTCSNVSKDEIKKEIDRSLMTVPAPEYDENSSIPLSVEVQNILSRMVLEAKREGAEKADSLHLLCAITENGSGLCSELLAREGVDYTRLASVGKGKAEPAPAPAPAKAAPVKKSLLEEFGTDLSAAAEAGTLDPVIGRDEEIYRLVQILGRRKKNNPLLIGEAGVGKSAIVEGLALRIASRKVPVQMLHKRVVTLDLASVVAGTKYRGEFEERLKNIVAELSADPDVIVFIDEIHTIVGAGGASGTLDAANILKPALARGGIQCIGATTVEEYRRILEKDSSLERRFQKVRVEPTGSEATLAILNGVRGKYEEYHKVRYDDDAVRACISLTARYVNGRNFPDKAIDALDEAGAAVRLAGAPMSARIAGLYAERSKAVQDKREAVLSGDFETAAGIYSLEKKLSAKIDRAEKQACDSPSAFRTVTVRDVEAVVSMMSGVPVEKIAEKEVLKLLEMESRIKKRIIGQDEAVETVVRAVKRSRSGIKDPSRPVGTFIFFGPTGVGKTELAKAVAAELFDSEDNLIRVDMSEFGDKFTSSRLVGAPPGYVGYDQGGELSGKVRSKPYSVVLLDEIEKAHPDIFNMLLQVMDEGRLTDGNGRTADFRNCIIIMTSNAGSREAEDFGRGLGFTSGDGSAGRKAVQDKAVRRIFPPEFLNRIDAQVHFRQLSREDVLKIAGIEISKLAARVREAGFALSVSAGAREFIADRGYDQRYGARPLRRAISECLEDPVSETILRIRSGEYSGGTGRLSAALDRRSGKITIRIQ